MILFLQIVKYKPNRKWVGFGVHNPFIEVQCGVIAEYQVQILQSFGEKERLQ